MDTNKKLLIKVPVYVSQETERECESYIKLFEEFKVRTVCDDK